MYALAGLSDGGRKAVLVILDNDGTRLGEHFQVELTPRKFDDHSAPVWLGNARELEYGTTGNAYTVATNQVLTAPELEELHRKLAKLYGKQSVELATRAQTWLNTI